MRQCSQVLLQTPLQFPARTQAFLCLPQPAVIRGSPGTVSSQMGCRSGVSCFEDWSTGSGPCAGNPFISPLHPSQRVQEAALAREKGNWGIKPASLHSMDAPNTHTHRLHLFFLCSSDCNGSRAGSHPREAANKESTKKTQLVTLDSGLLSQCKGTGLTC